MSNEPMLDATLMRELLQNGYSFFVMVPGRGVCAVGRMAFTVGLFYGMDAQTYQGRYCYESLFEAIEALVQWDGNGDPTGDWVKHKGVGGEYSNPNYTKE